MRLFTSSPLAFAAFFGLAGAVHAQAVQPSETPTESIPGASPTGIDEIVVTAQKRSESAQRVPIAITAIGGDQLVQRGIIDVASLQRSVPNLNFGENIGRARISIRGIGVDSLSQAAEGAVALNIDGVYMARTWVGLTAFYDLDRVEVLRGPQGTLYGRNVTAGAINLITKRPTTSFEGYAQAEVGNYDLFGGEAAISGPLIGDKLLARVSVKTVDRGGYGKNVVNGDDIDNQNTRAIRAQIEARPNENLDILLALSAFKDNSRAGGYHTSGISGQQLADGTTLTPSGILAGGRFAQDPRDLANDRSPFSRRRYYGGTLNINYDIGEEVSLRSLSSFYNVKQRSGGDCDATSVGMCYVDTRDSAKQYSQELQLSWQTARNSLVLGAYYFVEDLDGFQSAPFDLGTVLNSFSPNPNLPFTPLGFKQGFLAGGSLKTTAGAIFAQDTFSLTDRLKLTAGARYSRERKKVFNQFGFDLANDFILGQESPYPGTPLVTSADSKTFGSFTPRLGIDFQITPSTLLYASWSKGFRSGTFNLGLVPTNGVGPEKITDIEAGLKATLLDGKLRTNLAAFHYKYTGLQVTKIRNAGQILENAASAEVYGIEAEVSAKPSERLQIDLSGAWLHARFTDFVSIDPARPSGDGVTTENGVPAFDLSGNSLVQAPNFSLNASAQYTLPIAGGQLSFRPEVNWTDKVYHSPFNRDIKGLFQPAYAIVNADIRFVSADKAWQVSLWVKNLTDKLVVTSGQVTSSLINGGITTYLNNPRTFGVRVRRNF